MLLSTLWRPQGVQIDVSWAEFSVPAGAITAAQTVPAPTQTATADHLAGALSVQASWAELQLPGGAALSSITVAQTVPLPAQSVTIDSNATKSIQASWVELQLPDTALVARDITATQTVPAPAQYATMYDIIGQINGGGTITETLPWRVVGATQTVPLPSQSAAIGNVGDPLGPLNVTAAQTVPAPTQVAVADLQRIVTVTQTVPAPSQVARIVDPARTATGTGGILAPRKKRTQRVWDGSERPREWGEAESVPAAAPAEPVAPIVGLPPMLRAPEPVAAPKAAPVGTEFAELFAARAQYEAQAAERELIALTVQQMVSDAVRQERKRLAAAMLLLI